MVLDVMGLGAMILYDRDGIRHRVPDLDAPNWIRAGYTLHPPKPEPVCPMPTPAIQQAASTIPDALTRINVADSRQEIAELPTIGPAAARLILAARPEGGYTSLGHIWALCPELTKAPYRVKPDMVAEWRLADALST